MNIKNLGATCPFSLVIFDHWENWLTLYMLDMLKLVVYNLRFHECFIKYLALILVIRDRNSPSKSILPFFTVVHAKVYPNCISGNRGVDSFLNPGGLAVV